MAKDFNLDLDNMEIEGSDNDVDAPISSDNIGDESWDLIDNDSNFFNGTELDLTEGSIESKIFDIISDHNGVSNSLLPPCFLRFISTTFVSFSPFFVLICSSPLMKSFYQFLVKLAIVSYKPCNIWSPPF